jgi:tetratricopeptide (TPR) repeat protein
MKTINFIPLILAAILLVTAASANATDKYTEAMQKNITIVYTSRSATELTNAVNVFERIGEAEKTKWEPYYYAAFGYLMMATSEQEPAKKDNLLDLSLKSLEKAKAVNPTESETAALEGFVHMIRVSVDPASRGQLYSGLAMKAFGKAIALNPDNPRALSLMAQMQYGTAQFFGTSTIEACGTLSKALDKFETYKSANALAPQWGKSMAEAMKSKCN